MAAGARRSAQLATVDALTELNHFSCCAFRNGKRGRAGVWMGALWRLRGLYNGIAGWSCRARTCRDVRGTAFGTALIDNPVDASAYIVGNVERAIRSHGQARGTMFGFGWRLHRSRETIRKYFALGGCAVPGEGLKDYVVATLRIWRAIPRPVEGDENTVTVARRKLFPVVAHHCIGRPMGGKRRRGSNLVRAYADRFGVATVFGSQNQLLHERVVVALGPAIVSLWFQEQQLFRRQCGLLVGFKQVGPIGVQLVASVLGHKHSAT